MTGDAPQPVLSLRRIDLTGDRLLESPVEEYGMIVTSGAPLGWLRTGDALHVFDGLPVKLVIKGCEMMDRALPLLENVLVAFPAKLGVHEKVRRDRSPDVRLG